MKTKKEMPKELLKKWMDFLSAYSFQSPAYPVHFAELMKKNTGMAAINTIYSLGCDGMERKNPVISVLGDSISAGHFEWAISEDEVERFLSGELKESEEKILEVVDLRAVYHEQFRLMLADYYGNTSVSVINAGIAGDTLVGMRNRLNRDVLSYRPDLVILNGSMNWNDTLGCAKDYGNLLEEIVEKIKKETDADVILMTPNLSAPIDQEDAEKLCARVEYIRGIAEKHQLCLADVYGFWKEFCEMYHPDISQMFANGINHPTFAGHTVYAECLMQLVRRAGK